MCKIFCTVERPDINGDPVNFSLSLSVQTLNMNIAHFINGYKIFSCDAHTNAGHTLCNFHFLYSPVEKKKKEIII